MAETVTNRRDGADRNSRSAVSPPTRGTHAATGPADHRQIILLPEISRVSRVGSRRNSVRDRAAIAPSIPDVTNARATALR